MAVLIVCGDPAHPLVERAGERGLVRLGLGMSGAAGIEPMAGEDPTELWERVPPPRIALFAPAAQEAAAEVLDRLCGLLEPGDVVLDASASWWCDTLRRWRRLRHRALHMIDLAELRAPGGPVLLAGGEERALEAAGAVLDALAPAGGWHHAGSPASAHFTRGIADAVATAVRLVHDEAVQLAEAFPGRLDGALARALWPGVEDGEGRESWVLDDAVRLEAAVPMLAQAVMLAMAERLEAHASRPPPPREGPFLSPEDLDEPGAL